MVVTSHGNEAFASETFLVKISEDQGEYSGIYSLTISQFCTHD